MSDTFEPDDELLEAALAKAEEGDWEEMARLLRGGLEVTPDDPALLCWLGVAEQEMGEEGSAYDLFRQALSHEPEDPHVLALAGHGIAAFDDPDAEPALRSAALLAPDLPIARLYYGAYLAREGMFDEALRELDAARALEPDDSVIETERGVALGLRRDPAAMEAFDRAVALDAEDGWARVLQGLARLEFDRDPEGTRSAAEALEWGARLRPDDSEAQLLAAAALVAAGRPDAGWEFVERARMTAEGADEELLEGIEDRLDEPAEMETHLRTAIAPMAWHDRLMTRP